MNKKGFTLIELLAVIVLIGIVGIIVVPSVLDDLNTSKDKSYEILINDIKVAAENYYQECEYGDLNNTIKDLDKSQYGNCAKIKVSENEYYIQNISLIALANTGFLTASDKDGNKIIKDPKSDKDISNCTIKITKNKDANGKVTYRVTNTGGTNCPTY